MFHVEESHTKESVEIVTSDVSQRRKKISHSKYQEFPESESIAAKGIGPFCNGLPSIPGPLEPHNLRKTTNLRLFSFSVCHF